MSGKSALCSLSEVQPTQFDHWGEKTNRGTASPILRVHSPSAAMTDSSARAADLYWIVSLKEQCQPLEDLQWIGGEKTHVWKSCWQECNKNLMSATVKVTEMHLPFLNIYASFPPIILKFQSPYCCCSGAHEIMIQTRPHALLSRLWFEGSSGSWCCETCCGLLKIVQSKWS